MILTFKQISRIGLIILLFCFIRLSPGQDVAKEGLSLQQAIDEALQNNDLLKQTEARIKGEQAGVQEADGALLPKIDANLSYTYLDIVPGFKMQKLGNIQHDIQPSVSIIQPLYTGGKLKYSQQAAQSGLRSMQESFLAQQLSTKLAVTLSYYQLQSLDNEIKIMQESRSQLQTLQRYTRLLVQSGRMSQLEMDRIGVSLSAADGKLLQLENDYRSLCYTLSYLMGRKEQAIFTPVDSLRLEPFSLSSARLLETAKQKNPQFKRFDWEQQKAEMQVNMQRAARKPQVSAAAWYGYEFGLESFSLDQNKRYFLGITAKMPLYDGHVIGSRVEKAQAAVEQILWQKEYFTRQLSAELQSAHERVLEKERLLSIEKEAAELARRSYRLALIEYHAGHRSNTDLLDIQKDVLNSELRYNEAAVNYNKSIANLFYLIGIL